MYVYIEQQLACRKKISLCTSCHHHHPNAHRNDANTHSITSITASFHKTNLPVDTRHKITYICDMYFSDICHFRPMTQPNPLKTQIFDPFPTQPNPRVNPTHGQLWIAYFDATYTCPARCAAFIVQMTVISVCIFAVVHRCFQSISQSRHISKAPQVAGESEAWKES